MKAPDSIVLPRGYSFAAEGSILPIEIVSIRTAADWGAYVSEDTWKKQMNDAPATVGIRHETSGLVGIGFLVGSLRHAVLCDTVVHPEHRKQGIGTAILERRIQIADKFEIPYLYTELIPQNPLRARYLELGFLATGNTFFRRNK